MKIQNELQPGTLEKGSESLTKLQPNGPAAAMVLAAGIGSAVYGMVVSAAAASPNLTKMLNWWNPVGPLSGKTSVGVMVWLVALGVLSLLWRAREVSFRRVWVVTIVLLAMSFALTFPPVYDMFAPHH